MLSVRSRPRVCEERLPLPAESWPSEPPRSWPMGGEGAIRRWPSTSRNTSCLSCLALPESHRRHIRTTNGLERFNQEIKRRARVVRIFPNREACLRLVTAIAVEQSEEWVTGRRYLDMEQLKEHRCCYEERQGEEVRLMQQ